MQVQRLIHLVLLVVASGCSTLPTADEQRRELQSKLKTITYHNGIDEREAKIIADAYLSEHMAASFGHIGPYDRGTIWLFKITGDVVPIELTNFPPVLVDKKTGSVTWEAGLPTKR